MKRIHVVGCGPRSGTTLLTELMVTCFDIDLFTDHEDRISAWPSRPCKIFLTKSPRDIKIIGPVLRWVPNLYVLYLLRDPRDMVVSRHGNEPDLYWSGLNFWKLYHPFGVALSKHPRFITIKYEDLVAGPDRIQQYISERMPFLVARMKFSEFHKFSAPSDKSLKALGGIRPVSSASVGNWKNHKARIAGQLMLHGSITEDLIHFGYEENGQWEQLLTGVEPDRQPSYWPEFFSAKEHESILKNKWVRVLWVLVGNSALGLNGRKVYYRLKNSLLRFLNQ